MILDLDDDMYVLSMGNEVVIALSRDNLRLRHKQATMLLEMVFGLDLRLISPTVVVEEEEGGGLCVCGHDWVIHPYGCHHCGCKSFVKAYAGERTLAGLLCDNDPCKRPFMEHFIQDSEACSLFTYAWKEDDGE